MVYHAADYRNPTTIASTWDSLIEQTHSDVVQKLQQGGPGIPTHPQPYESVASKIQSIAHRTSLDSFIFPIPMLLPALCSYAVTQHQDAEIGADPTWPVQLFLALSVPYDMITRILENMFDTQDMPFTGMVRNRLVELIVYVVDAWQRDTKRRGATSSAKGDAAIGPWVRDLLVRCEVALPPAGHGHNNGGADLADVRRRLRNVKRDVEALADRRGGGSLGFM